jgi:hypothetical protein
MKNHMKRLTFKFGVYLTLIGLLFGMSSTSRIFAQAVTFSQTGTGFYNPTGTGTYGGSCGSWLGRDSNNGGCYIDGLYHIGYDIMTNEGLPAFAIAPGRVLRRSINGWEGSNVALLITHTLSDGSQFNALYGHILSDFQEGDYVSGGVQIGTIGNHSGGDHLHFGIYPSASIPTGRWGNLYNSSYASTNGFVNPTNWITTRAPKCENGSSQRYKPYGGEPVHPDGTLIKTAGSGTVYVLDGNVRRPIPSAARLYELYGPGRGFGFQDVITISTQEMNQYPLGSTVNSPLPYNGRNQPDGRLIKQWGSGEVAMVTDNGMRRVFTGEAFLRLGYSFCNVAGVSDYYSYPQGPDITH